MALSSYALIDLPTLKSYKGVEGTGEDDRLISAINAASAWIETATERHFVTRGAVTEYHSLDKWGIHTITLSQSPIITLTSVHESTGSPRVYDATSILTTATDYLAVSNVDRAQIRRLSSSDLTDWAVGYRCIQVIYSYGYASTATIPADLAFLATYLAYSIYKEADRGWHGMVSVSDAQGSVTRLGRHLPPEMKAVLDGYTRVMFERTWEVA